MTNNEYYPFAPSSNTFAEILYSIDSKFYNFEETVKELEKEVEEYKTLYYQELRKSTQSANSMIANTLLACIGGVPTGEAMNPAFATAIVRIGDMTSIEEVHEYVQQYKKQFEQMI